MKKKLIILCVIIISYVFSFGFCNYNTLKSNNIGIKNISQENIQLAKNDNQTTIKIKAEGEVEYINKILFDYKAEANTTWKMIVNCLNVYGFYDTKVIEGNANSVIDVFEEKIDSKVIDLEIVFNGNINIDNFKINNEIDFFSNYTIFFVILGFDIAVLFLYRKQFKEKIEYLFLVLALSGGVIIILMHPYGVNISWDDQIHYENIYGLANKYYTVAGRNLIDADGFGYGSFNTEKENSQFAEYLNKMNEVDTGIYTQKKFTIQSLAYMPSAIVFKICGILKVPFALAFILAKLIILILYVAVVFVAIRLTPKFKYLMLTIALIPIELFLASNYSYDPPVVAFTLLGFAFYFRELMSNEKINYKNILGTTISFIIASSAKAIYCPLLFLLLFIKKDKFESQKQRRNFYILIVLIFLLMMSTFMIPMLNNEMQGDTRGGDTSVYGQINLIMSAPVSFATVVYNNVVLQFFDKFISTLALYDLQYMKPHISSIGYFLLLFIMFLSIYIDDDKKIKFNKIIIGVILFMIIGMIWGSMYLTFTPVGSEIIQGVQGRYFIPILLPFLLLLYTPNIKCKMSSEKLYAIYAICLTIITFSEIFECIL